MFIPDPVSDFFPSRIPDPNCLHPGSRIRIKELKYFNPKKTKKWFLSSRKYDPGCSSRIPDPDADFLPITDPGSRGQKGIGSRIQGSKRHRIPDPDQQHWLKRTLTAVIISLGNPKWSGSNFSIIPGSKSGSKTRPNKMYRSKQMVNKGGVICIKRAKPYFAKKVETGYKENVPDSDPTSQP